MVILEAMTEAEFQSFLEPSIAEYAQDHVVAGRWTEEEALEKARQEFHALLPDGIATPDNYLFTPLFHFYQQNPENARAFLKELLFRSGKQSTHQPFKGGQENFFIARLAELIRQRQERGELRQDMNPYLAAGGFFALYFASLTSWSGAFLALDTSFFDHLRDLFGLQIQGMLP